MRIIVDCPQALTNVKVVATGAGSGAPGTICVCGSYFSTFDLPFFQMVAALFKALLRWLKSIFWPLTGSNKIRVHVVNRGAPAPSEKAPGTDVSPPTSPWCARNVPVPAWSAAGSPLTVYAWLLDSNDSILDGPHTVDFNGGGANPVDCCANCPPGSGTRAPLLARELESDPRLEVNVQDGPNAGRHIAKCIAFLTWEASIRGVVYKLSCDAGSAFVIRGPSFSLASTVVESDPFSAIFPGALFGADRDVVVTIA
jgi:hypothetical protein